MLILATTRHLSVKDLQRERQGLYGANMNDAPDADANAFLQAHPEPSQGATRVFRKLLPKKA